ncbi:MAG: ParB/RepB/Spo0J family partition protein [Pseudomonadota bacterium]
MKKKKRFGVSEAITRGLSETIAVVENNPAKFRSAAIPLSRIELDPDNPRKLTITLDDVKLGLKKEDRHLKQKKLELERLNELAQTVKNSGVINPIVVYKHSDLYRVVAGERRCLASILANKTEIEARVYTEKPNQFDLKLLQWVENTAREDLKLYERIGNIKAIIHAYQAEFQGTIISVTKLSEITGLSISQCSYYLTVLSSPEDVKQLIAEMRINNLDKAVFLAKIEDKSIRSELIDAALQNKSLRELKLILEQHIKISKNVVHKSRGRKTTRINLGTTKKPAVVKAIVENFLTKAPFSQYARHFKDIDWNDLKAATKSFKEFIELFETEV